MSSFFSTIGNPLLAGTSLSPENYIEDELEDGAYTRTKRPGETIETIGTVDVSHANDLPVLDEMYDWMLDYYRLLFESLRNIGTTVDVLDYFAPDPPLQDPETKEYVIITKTKEIIKKIRETIDDVKEVGKERLEEKNAIICDTTILTLFNSIVNIECPANPSGGMILKIELSESLCVSDCLGVPDNPIYVKPIFVIRETLGIQVSDFCGNVDLGDGGVRQKLNISEQESLQVSAQDNVYLPEPLLIQQQESFDLTDEEPVGEV